MESERIFEILDNFEEDLDENYLLEELKKIYEEEIKCSFQGPERNNYYQQSNDKPVKKLLLIINFQRRKKD